MQFLLIFSIFLASANVYSARSYNLNEETVVFSGRISKINKDAKLVRIKIKFENAKFISKNNRLEIWNESVPEKKVYWKNRG